MGTTFKEIFTKHIKPKHKPKPAFKRNGKFNPDNWFDKEFNEIRDLLEKLTDYGSKDYVSKRLRIEYMWYADEKYYFIYYLEEQFLYIINWYKSWGTVDSFLFQGEPIDKGDFKYLMDRLKEVI